MEVDASRTAGTPPPRVKRSTSAHKTGWTQSVMVPPWCIQRRVQIPPPPSSIGVVDKWVDLEVRISPGTKRG
jgi:hypothetical protein